MLYEVITKSPKEMVDFYEDLVNRYPIVSIEDGTVWVVLNGEIYNFPDLRLRLEAKGHRFSYNFV